MIKAILIDDEKLARDVLKAYLKAHEDVQIVAECANGFDGIKAIQEHKPDLLFLDVQMPKLTGFEMLELLDEPPVIIFSTAFDQYAIKAFELSAADYLLKPYDQERFDKAMENARAKIRDPESKSKTKEVVENYQKEEELDRVVIRTGHKILILAVGDVDFFEAQDDYVAIYAQGKKYLKQWRMKYLEDSLPENQFVRVHRSYIVNLDRIDRIEPFSKDTYIAILKSGEKANVSRSGYQKLREILHM